MPGLLLLISFSNKVVGNGVHYSVWDVREREVRKREDCVQRIVRALIPLWFIHMIGFIAEK